MWLSDFTLVLPDRVVERGSLRIADGRIAEIVESPVPGGVPGDGLHLFAGFVDMHGDMIETELEPRPRVDMPMELALNQLDARLAASGVTTAYAAVSFTKGAKDGARRSFSHTSDVIRALRAGVGRLRVDHRVHARFDITLDDAVETVEALIRDGAVDLVSLMDHTPGQGQYRNLERHVDQIAHMRGVSHDEARVLVKEKIAERTRPADVLARVLDAVSTLCRANGVALASHDDDTEAKVDLMASLGVTVSEFPVTEEAARRARDKGVMTAMGAPNALRGTSYSGNLSAREAHAAGLLTILAADYHPGTILPAVLILAKTDPGGLAGAARLATVNAAEAMGLGDRGALAPGLRADLAVADVTGVGRIVTTVVAGQVAYSDGTLPWPADADRPQEAMRTG